MGQDVGAEAEGGGHRWQGESRRWSPALDGAGKKMPRAGSYWGEEIPAQGGVWIPKEKSYPGAQNSTGVLSAIFTFICTVNKGGFMALGPFAPFSYIFRRKRIIWASLLFA